MRGQTCRECGAATPDRRCAQLFEACLANDFGDSDHLRVHHLLVPSYMLQHPSRLSRDGWFAMRDMLELFVREGKSPAQASRELRFGLDGGNRAFSFRKGTPASFELRWSRTIADVRCDTGANYSSDVRRWAAAVLDDAAAVQR